MDARALKQKEIYCNHGHLHCRGMNLVPGYSTERENSHSWGGSPPGRRSLHLPGEARRTAQPGTRRRAAAQRGQATEELCGGEEESATQQQRGRARAAARISPRRRAGGAERVGGSRGSMRRRSRLCCPRFVGVG